jgi:hypothetical protein
VHAILNDLTRFQKLSQEAWVIGLTSPGDILSGNAGARAADEAAIAEHNAVMTRPAAFEPVGERVQRAHGGGANAVRGLSGLFLNKDNC